MMYYYNIAINYLGILILFFSLFFTGFLFFKRVTIERRIQLLLPAGSIFGICLYIFLLNLTAHFIKGVPGFLFALFIQISLAFLLTKFIPSSPIILPSSKEAKIWIFTLFLWVVFSYQITAHAITDGADSTLHQSFASRFIRGDYPMHTPWQPDYIAYYHFGGAELLGSLHALTGSPYYFLHPFIAFWMLVFVSQILTWIILLPRKLSIKSVFLRSLPAFVGLISLGGFFIVWSTNFALPSIIQFPTFYNALEVYGAPFSLDALVFFIHRFLATSFFIALLVLLLYPKKKSLLSLFTLAIFLAAMALTDESVLIVTILPILIISFFKFLINLLNILLFVSLIFLIILSQGGLITETIVNRYGDNSNILIFPKDSNLPHEKYLSYRLYQQSSRFQLSNEKLNSLNWIHPGIIWQLIFLLILTIYLSKKRENWDLKALSFILLVSGIVSLVAFHGLVPKGYTHPNGNRFLALSYYLSGLGLGYLFCYWFNQTTSIPKIIRYSLNFLIIWILLISLVPPLLKLFPRKVDNWFIIKPHVANPIIKWVENNIPLDKRIVALTSLHPYNSMNIELVTAAGALTPMWPPKPRVHDSFDIGPTYADLHYTLNPKTINDLKINYILVTDSYISQLPRKRQQDLKNKDFFSPLFSTNNNTIIILMVNPKYLTEGENYKGTYAELEEIAPLNGSFCIDYPPNITASTYRILRLLFHNRETYCDHGGAFYNSRIDVELHSHGEILDRYDFLVLGKDVDPKTICNCRAKLLWSGLGNDVKFWQTQY